MKYPPIAAPSSIRSGYPPQLATVLPKRKLWSVSHYITTPAESDDGRIFQCAKVNFWSSKVTLRDCNCHILLGSEKNGAMERRTFRPERRTARAFQNREEAGNGLTSHDGRAKVFTRHHCCIPQVPLVGGNAEHRDDEGLNKNGYIKKEQKWQQPDGILSYLASSLNFGRYTPGKGEGTREGELLSTQVRNSRPRDSSEPR